jgi:2-keto-3-deoxy-L-rhamnonate aldolase RhmA
VKINNIVTRVNAGQRAYGFTLTFPSTAMVELMGLAGFDYVSFDAEHGPFSVESLDDLCRVAEGSGLTPTARVPNIERSTVLQFLDRGILGITGPHVTTRAKAQQLADACRYTPLGKRSYGSGRGASFGVLDSFTEYMEHRNSQLVVMAQLEDAEVLDDLDGILSVDGIDYYSSGPQDIAQSMGLPGQPNHPRVKKFEATVRDTVHAAGKKMTDDVMVVARTSDLVLDAASAFLKNERSG